MGKCGDLEMGNVKNVVKYKFGIGEKEPKILGNREKIKYYREMEKIVQGSMYHELICHICVTFVAGYPGSFKISIFYL